MQEITSDTQSINLIITALLDLFLEVQHRLKDSLEVWFPPICCLIQCNHHLLCINYSLALRLG